MVHFLVKMGQSTSMPKGRRKSLRSFARKSASHPSNLSHTFAIVDNDDRVEQMNINIASEEELMTLVGITRQLAKNIVEHRKCIGRFRKIEDIATVSGVGAKRLEAIRPEICVSMKINQSCASSRAQSYDSLRSADSRLTVRSNRLVNVNRATVFELQGVCGITQEIAAAIVHYREKKGPFQRIEELIKVKNIDRIRLDNIQRFLTIENIELPEQDPRGPPILTNGFTNSSLHLPTQNGGPMKHSIMNGLSTSSAVDIFELLSAYSPRPIVEDMFKYTRNGETAIRVASWNLHGFSSEKANNLGVREVVCRTILENGWSIIAVQDVSNVVALKAICEELNRPKLRRVSEWKDKNHNWNFCMLDVRDSKLGFIYDSDGALDIELTSLNEGPIETQQDCDVLIGAFRVNELNLQLVNLTTKKQAHFGNLHSKITELVSEKDSLVVLIDFAKTAIFTDTLLGLGGLKSILPSSTCTSYTQSRQEVNHHISNILVNKKLQNQLTGLNGIVKQGITHLAIPNGWSWGGPVSPYCPVWTELFLNSNSGTAL